MTGRWRIAGLGGLADSGGGDRGIHGTADGDECADSPSGDRAHNLIDPDGHGKAR